MNSRKATNPDPKVMGGSVKHPPLWQQRKFLSLLLGIAVAGYLELSSLLGGRLPLAVIIPTVVILIATFGRETISKGFRALRRMDLTSISLLMLVAVAGAMATLQFEEAATIIVLFSLSEELELYGIQSSRTALKALIERVPKTARLVGSNESIPIDKLEIGDVIRIQPSDIIPIDGKIVAGATSVDESMLTGEPIPSEKTIDELVYAGTTNLNGTLDVRITVLPQDSTVAKIVSQTFAAAKNRAPTQQFVERFARIYTPLVLIIATGIAVVPPLFFHENFSYWFLQALTLLVISCPCALVIATPIAIFSAIGAASGKGIVVKGGRSLEALSNINVLALDKTRTLTFGKPIVTDIIAFNGFSNDDLVACAAGLEVYSEHPVARAVVIAAEAADLKPHAIKDFQSVFGMGAMAACLECDSSEHRLGKLQFIQDSLTLSAEESRAVRQIEEQGKTAILLASDKLEGIIAVFDEIRPEAAKFIRQISALGIKPVLLTGDNQSVAEQVGKTLQIDEIHAALLPQEKAELIEKLRKNGNVAMLGDGVNDAPALATANVGIAMGMTGSDTAIDTASIVLLNDKISLIPSLIKLCRRTVRMNKFNIGVTMGVKAAFILLALFGLSNLALAVLADVGLTLVVVLLSLTLMSFEFEPDGV